MAELFTDFLLLAAGFLVVIKTETNMANHKAAIVIHTGVSKGCKSMFFLDPTDDGCR